MTSASRTNSRTRLERREEDILEAATELFASAGFHATSTRRIAEAAGVSEGTVFHYFGSKQDLMLAILDRFYNRRLNRRAEAILDATMGTHERLRELALNHVTQLAADRALMMRLIQVYIGVDLLYINMDQSSKEEESPIRALNRRYVGYFDRTLREGMERGDVRADVDLKVCRDLYFGGLEYGMRTFLYRHRESAEDGLHEYIGSLLEPIWRYLSGDSGQNSGTSTGDQTGLAARLEAVTRRLERLAGK